MTTLSPPVESMLQTAAPGLTTRELGMRKPFPAAFVGETVRVRAEHEWPGNLFASLSSLITFGLGLLACGMIVTGVFTLNPATLGLGVGAGVWCMAQRRLTAGVRRFTHWGWYGAMMEIGAVTAAKLWALATGSASEFGLGLILDIVWLRYFWRRRADFDVDLGG